jgi:sigma-B regulation protein RsbU (phosphoserine phosphatase)
MGITLTRIYDFASLNIKEQELADLNLYATGIAAQFDSLSQIATTTANIMSQDEEITEEEMYGLLLSNVAGNPQVYGAAIAFEPFSFNEDTRLFSPYAYGEDGNLATLDVGADSYDYTDGSWDWYSAVKESGQALWTEPFFDEGAGDVLMTTYSAPFYREGIFAGVATVDVQLDALNKDIAQQFTGKNFIILSQTGNFISHYNPSMVMSSSIQDQTALQNNPAYTQAVANILQGQSGQSSINNLFINGEIIEGESLIFYTPVSTMDWVLTSTIASSDLTRELRTQITFGIYGLALMIVLIFALTLYVSSRLTRPIKTLSIAVSDIARGKLDTKIEKIHSMDELGLLSIGFNRMLKNLKKQIELQSQQSADRQMVDRELEMARQTQQALLPSTFPPFPERREFDLYAVSKAARHVAGDFFDFFLINPKQLVFVIADVSGKGMAAALVMAVTRTIIRNLAQSGKSPAAILTETNELLRESHSGAAFVTIFLGIYNTNNGRIQYANGGHSSCLMIDKQGKVTPMGAATGTIVGMLENQEYSNAEMRLNPGESLVLYTDGLSEARSPSGEFYGEGRIRSFLEGRNGQTTERLCNDLEKETCGFQEMNLADDLTILAIRRIGSRMTRMLEDLIKGKGT